MAAVSMTAMLHHLSALTVDEWSDGQLLQRFVATGDETAFTTLVQRHSRLVLSVGRRFLGNGPDLDDVFQATFLVLIRKAASIHKQASLASWLHGVAHRLALKIKGKRLRPVEGLVNHMAELQTLPIDPGAQASLRELGTILDEELQRLPAGCRDALVLCFLEGLSHAEAAQHLGWALGTFKGRLLRGRRLLRQRLERRGIALSTMALSVVLAEQAGTAAPAALVRATAHKVVHRTVSSKVAALADGAVRALSVGKVKLTVLALFLVSLLGFAVGALPFAPAHANSSAADPSTLTAAQPKDAPVARDAFDDPLPPGAVARLGTVRWRHAAPVHFVALLPDGKTAVSAANDRFVRVWDLATGKELHRFGPGPQPERPTSGIVIVFGSQGEPVLTAVSRDGKVVATQFDHGDITLWEVATGKKLGTVALGKGILGAVGALAFAPDGKQLAIASVRGPVRLYDIDAGKVVREFGKAPKEMTLLLGGGATPCAVVYAPDGKTLVSVQGDQGNGTTQIHFWDPQTGQEVRSVAVPGQAGIGQPVFSPDGTLFAYGMQDSEVVLLRAASGELLHKLKVPGTSIRHLLAFAADSTKLYVKPSNPPLLLEWDVKTGKLLHQWPRAGADNVKPYRVPASVAALAMSPDGKTAAFGGGNTLCFVDLATGKDLPAPAGHSHNLQMLQYTPDSKGVLTRAADGTYRLWDAGTGKQLKQLPLPAQGASFATTPDGRYTAVKNAKQAIVLIDNNSGKEVVTLAGSGQPTPVFLPAPDSRTLLVRWPDENALVLYDIPSGKERCRIALAEAQPDLLGGGFPARFFFAPDGRRLAVYASTMGLTVHETTTGRIVGKIDFGSKVNLRGGAFSPDGRTIALDHGDGTVRVVELVTGTERGNYGEKFSFKASGQMSGGLMVGGAARFGGLEAVMVAFSPDGRLLAHAGLDRVLHVWDVTGGQALARFAGHQGPIATFAFAPDGRSVATASGDTTALVWDVQGLSAKAALKIQVLDAAAVKAHWNDLANKDGQAGAKAITALTASPKQTVAFLKSQLQPTPAVAPAVIAKLIEQLDSAEFKVRQKAHEELLQVGEQAVPHLEKTMAGQINLEMRRRLEQTHAVLTALTWTGARLQMMRAIEVLERIGSADARQVLQTLADGAPGALATTQARDALQRLKKGTNP